MSTGAMNSFVLKIRRNLADHGLLATLKKSAGALLKPFFHRKVYRLYRIDLRNSTCEPEDVAGFEFRFLSPGDTKAIQQVEGLSEWLAGSLQKRIEKNELCLAVFDGDEVAGFNLISFGDIYMPLVKVRKTFRPDCAWSEQISVAKLYRKHGLAAQLRYRIFRELRRRGFHRLYGGALADNEPSLKLARRVGFEEFVDVTYLRLLFWEGWRYTKVVS